MKLLKWMQRSAVAGLRGLASLIERIGGPKPRDGGGPTPPPKL